MSLTITNKLSGGTALVGSVGIDQTIPGTTDSVTVKNAGAFANITTSTLSNVAASVTNVTVLAANAARKRIIIHNDSTSRLRLKFGATASATSFSVLLDTYDTYESPVAPVYVGIIDGIWEVAVGSARVTEMV